MGFHFQNCKHFLEYLGSNYWLHSIQNNDSRNFYSFVYFQSYNDKSKFSFFTNSPVKVQHVLYTNESFLRKMLVSFFNSDIALNIEKNPAQKLCKVLEMELKTYTPVNTKFVFKKIKFEVLHYIQHDFINQRLGLSKDQTSMFKSFVINYFDRRLRNTFKNIIWLL